MAEPALDGGQIAGRVPPRGEQGAALMILVDHPEAGDTHTLLAGPQGKLIAALLSALGIAPAAAYAADNTITRSANDAVVESSVTIKIKSEFAKDKTVSATNIKVDTEDGGVVTLSGNAKSKAEADQAVRLARNTKGVTSVKNDMRVKG